METGNGDWESMTENQKPAIRKRYEFGIREPKVGSIYVGNRQGG